ncbi:S-layer homology domain-containing protein, partial [Christensenellaceae bacterium OttesenSCG-928-M15]|nr:S-layer homology domain-containing protein [Christensenellaceae bacterium OttesenSCG-928-M15]
QTEQRGHIYGLFEDVKWTDEDFDYIETAVYSGYVTWEKGADEKEYFYPANSVTRDELAKTVFIMGDFKNQDENAEILDLADSQNARIVQILVDNGVFALKDGKFLPGEYVTTGEIVAAMGYLG